ncbi:hypothetical protein EDC96DRAFT_546691 [Choanephora cucurbitarum]|nr:hypothetical protein EDC96DRAFT_546691 [Choanephora cucurbitarum]
MPRKGLEDTFNKCNFDIGWALTGGSRKNIKGCPTRYNKCLGAVYCDQEICPFFNKDMRLSYTLEKIKTQTCFHCKEALKHRESALLSAKADTLMTNTRDSNAVSPSFRSLLSVSPVYELSMCFQRQDESKIECKVQDMLSFIKGKYPTMRQFYNARKLKDQKEKQKEIIGKVQSSENKTALYKTDNLSYSSKCLKELSDSLECPQELLRARSTILVCYMLKR